jgi:hypothetical protein
MYLWELIGHDTAEGVLLSGIDGDLAAAMSAGEGPLGQQRGFIVRIIEVVGRMSVQSLDVIYVPTGRQWLGRRTISGGVHWEHAFRIIDPAAAYTLAPGQGAGSAASTTTG